MSGASTSAPAAAAKATITATSVTCSKCGLKSRALVAPAGPKATVGECRNTAMCDRRQRMAKKRAAREGAR